MKHAFLAALVGATLAAPALARDNETTLSAAAQADLGDARRATAPFVDVNVATSTAAGYGPFAFADAQGITCIASAQPGKGAMGVHYVNGALLDAVLDAKQPEALIYEPMPDGSQRLVGVEYIVFEAAWTGRKPPRLFGTEFHYTPVGNRYGIPAFYALHVWMWQPNPKGLFADYNPAVRCP